VLFSLSIENKASASSMVILSSILFNQWCSGKSGLEVGERSEVWGSEPPAGSRDRAPDRGSGSEAALKLTAFLFLDVPKEGPFSPHLKIEPFHI